jgi:hypothetical protein
MPDSLRPPPPHGNDHFLTIKLRRQRHGLALTYWDLWLLVVLLADFAGDCEQLANRFRDEIRALSPRRDTAEGLLSHLHELRQRLADAGVTPTAALGPDGPNLLKSERRRARREILEKYPDEQDKSTWMRHTPRRERQDQARRGYWSRFPVSPGQYAGALERLFKTSGYYSEDQSWELQRKLSAFLEREGAGAPPAEEAALDRAFLTVLLEKMDLIDDSYGVIGDLYAEILQQYCQLGRTVFVTAPTDFYQDLLEFILWEDYGFGDQGQTDFFASLTPAEAEIVEAILRAQWHELSALALEYQAERALTLIGMLCAQQKQFDRFVDLARQMGSRQWQRITAMSAMAEKHRRYDLALAVYEASLGPGRQEAYLRKQHAELQERLKTVKRKKRPRQK